MPHCRHITQVSRNQTQTNSIDIHPPIFSIPMPFDNDRVQEDFTAAPFRTMTGTVREPVDLQNPPPSPIRDLVTTPVENPSTDFTSQLTKQLTHEISSRKSAYGLACALAESAVQNGHTFVAEENYKDYMAQSPFHQAENCQTAAWVVLYRGTLGRPPFHGRDMIGPGSKICLFDTALALRYTGFEQPTLYAKLGGPFYRENGYHFFGSTPHLLCSHWGIPSHLSQLRRLS